MVDTHLGPALAWRERAAWIPGVGKELEEATEAQGVSYG